MPARAPARPKVTAPKDYSTTIRPDQTASECMSMLGRRGAKLAGILFDEDTRGPVGLSFVIRTANGDQHYHLPVKSKGVLRQLNEARDAGLLQSRKRPLASYLTEEHALAVAWRQLRDWLAAQTAMIEAGMWELDEVMLPWMLVAPDVTMYEAVQRQQFAMIEAGAGEG